MKYILGVPRLVIMLILFLLWLPGCIPVPRSPAPRFYTLQPIKEAQGSALTAAAYLKDMVIGIGPVTLPEYFNRPQIVTRNKDNTIEFAQFHRWAEPLDEAIARVIAKNFSPLLPATNVEIYPWNSVIPVRYQVVIEVIELDCRLDSDVTLLIQWSILDAQEKKVLLTRRSEYRKPVGTGDYPGVVQAMSVIYDALSREIAQALTDLAAPNPAVSQ
jgi:uncharacterized lipoprotein YmbA